MNPIIVHLKEHSYKILIEENLKRLPIELRSLRLGGEAVVITNPNVGALYGKFIREVLKDSVLRLTVITVPDSEKAKSLQEAYRLLNLISSIDGKGKRIFLLALGGGVVGDLSGFVAAVYRRGIPYVQLPTTLLAQVDSSIGGKVAVDMPAGKNLIGTFYQPRLVYADTSFIRTLSQRDFLSGMAEVIKYGIIRDKALFDYLERNREAILRRDAAALSAIITKCAKIKAGIVSMDERETKSIRTILNFGHTVGHGIEAAIGYSGAYSHGEAVALGMLAASRISSRLGYLSRKNLFKIEEMIGNFGLPVNLKRKTIIHKIMKSVDYDKKFIHGVTRFILPVNIGRVTIKERIPEKIIHNELEKLSRSLIV